MTESKVKVLVNLDMSTAFYRPFSEFFPFFSNYYKSRPPLQGGQNSFMPLLHDTHHSEPFSIFLYIGKNPYLLLYPLFFCQEILGRGSPQEKGFLGFCFAFLHCFALLFHYLNDSTFLSSPSEQLKSPLLDWLGLVKLVSVVSSLAKSLIKTDNLVQQLLVYAFICS